MNHMHAQHHDGVETIATLGPAHQQNEPTQGDLYHTDEATTMNHMHDGVEGAPSTTALVVVENASAPTSFFRLIREEENPNTIVKSMKQNRRYLDHTDEATSADFFDGWINLPTEMCRLVLDRLDAFDILRFPLGRGPWADAYAAKQRLQPGAPTLLTSPSDGWEIPDDYEQGLFFIHNIISREAFSVEVECLRYARLIGGKDGWLVTTIRESCVRLLNPITRRCIHLPNYLPVSSSDRVQLCRTPTEADGYFAIAISFCKLSYTMDGCDHWITLENPNVYWLSYYSDAIVHRGKIVSICRNGDLWSWDLDQGGKDPKLLVSSSIDTKGWTQFDLFLTPSLKGNILVVSPYREDIPIRWGHRGPCHSNHWNFHADGTLLHEVDIDAQSIEEVRDIGDRALFLGPSYPFYIPVSVPFGDLKKNCVYFADVSDYDVVSIDLSLEDIPGNVSLIDYSGLRNPDQRPMWFRPAFPDNEEEVW